MGRREQNKQKKRERLEAEGLRLFLEQGYDRTSIEQIAAASEVARGTYYLYFDDKLALFEALTDAWFQPLLALLQGVYDRLGAAGSRLDSLVIYLEMAQAVTELSMPNRQRVLMALRELRSATEGGERLRARELQLREAVVRLTEHAAERGLITVEDPRLASLVILGAVERLHYEWLVGEDMGDPQQMAEQVVRLFARALDLPVSDLAET